MVRYNARVLEMIFKFGIELVRDRVHFDKAIGLLALQGSYMEGLRAKSATHHGKALLLHIHAEVNANQFFFLKVTLVVETFLADYWDDSFRPLCRLTKLIVNFILKLGLFLLFSRLDCTRRLESVSGGWFV